MIKIKTHSIEIVNPKHDLMSVQPSMGQCYFKFNDGSEVTIPVKMTPQLQATLNIAATATAEVIEIDFTNPSQPIRMGNS